MILKASAAKGWSSLARRSHHFVAVQRRAFERRHIERRRQVVHHRVEQRLNTLVLEGRAGQHGHQFQRNRSSGEAKRAVLLAVSACSFKYLFEHRIVVLGNVLDHFAAMLFVKCFVDRRSLQRRGNVRAAFQKRVIPELFDFKDFKFRAEGFLEPDDGFFFDEIDARR